MKNQTPRGLVCTIVLVVSIVLFNNACIAQTQPLRLQNDGDPQSSVITSAAEVRSLSVIEASRSIPVKIQGVLTYHNGEHIAFVQDKSGGVYFSPDNSELIANEIASEWIPGTLVEIEGHSIPAGFSPSIGGQVRVKPLGFAQYPEPLQMDSDGLIDPEMDAQWIAIRASVTAVEKVGDDLQLSLIRKGGKFHALVLGDWNDENLPRDLIGSDVKLLGVYGSIFNSQRQLVGMQVFVPSMDQIEVVDRGFEKAFAQRPSGIDELMQFRHSVGGRVRVKGVVLSNFVKEGIFLRGKEGAIQVLPIVSEDCRIGQHLDVVGFTACGNVGPMILDAKVRATGLVAEPEPLELTTSSVDQVDYHGELVRLEGRVVDHFVRPYDSVIVLEVLGDHIYARVPHGGSALKESSWISVTGICMLHPKSSRAAAVRNFGPIDASDFRMGLIVRQERDIQILRLPSWWNARRIANLAAILAAIVAAMFAWGVMLRRKVKEQTDVIEAKIEGERLAEDRARIARELHDTIEQELVGVRIQLDNASSRIDYDPQRAKQSIELASAMLRHSQAEARRSVWDLKAPSVARGELVVALKEMIARFEDSDSLQISLRYEDKIPVLPARTTNHILRIAQEAVTNALKHADPTCIKIELLAEKDLLLRVSDDGCGFDTEDRPGVNDGHFGVSGMRERATKIQGTLRIESEKSRGTTVSLSVPLGQPVDSPLSPAEAAS